MSRVRLSRSHRLEPRAHRAVQAKDVGRTTNRAHFPVREGARRPRTQACAALCGALAAACALAMALSAQAETVQKDGIRVHFNAALTPKTLPRSSQAPVRVSFAATLGTRSSAAPPQLRQITIAINRNGHLDSSGLPVCQFNQVQPTTTADALAACGPSLIGEGKFQAKILIPDQATFPSAGKVLAFNGTYNGKPAILAHVYGTEPVPTSFTLPFTIGHAKGTFATVLRASLPAVTGNSGYVTGLSMTLGAVFTSHGKQHSYLSASCPAPAGFPGAVFPLARGTFAFAGNKTLTSTLTRSCKATG
jgi:hypothetical protein